MKFGVMVAVVLVAQAVLGAEHRLAMRTVVPAWFTNAVPVEVSGGSLDSLYADGTNVQVSVPETIVDPENPRRRIRAEAATVTSPEVVPFTVDRQGGVFAPIFGIAANSTNYFLVSSGITYFLLRDFEGNLQEVYGFDNPAMAQDATSFDENHILHLGTDNNLRKVDTRIFSGDDNLVPIGSSFSINVGIKSFGIGYNAALHEIGVGIYANGQMTFRRFCMTEYVFLADVTFPFSTAKYGTPTGLDFIRTQGGTDRFLVCTKEGSDIGLGPRNFFLEMSKKDGIVKQGKVTGGTTWKLNDILYEDGDLILVNQRPSLNDGRVQIGAYAPFEP